VYPWGAPGGQNHSAHQAFVDGIFIIHLSLNRDCPALLYGAARELILLASGYVPYGPIMLPTATFIDEAVQNNRKAKPQSGVEAL
jgi:hypothetical protein